MRQLCKTVLRVINTCVRIHETGVCLWTGCSGKDLFSQTIDLPCFQSCAAVFIHLRCPLALYNQYTRVYVCVCVCLE